MRSVENKKFIYFDLKNALAPLPKISIDVQGTY